MFIKGHKLFILPSIFNNKLHCLPNIVINFLKSHISKDKLLIFYLIN